MTAFVGNSSVHRSVEQAIKAELLNLLSSDGIDHDKDGTIDLDDDGGGGGGGGGGDANDRSERGAVAECDNGIDDDGDGFVDFHDLDANGSCDGIGDLGCLHPSNVRETAVPEPGFGLGLRLAAFGRLAASRTRRRNDQPAAWEPFC